MTFTDQNFTRLPLSNIRQSVLSWGPSCHLNWGPELREKHADGNVVLFKKKSLLLNNSFSEKQKLEFFCPHKQGIIQICTSFVIFMLHHSVWHFYTSPLLSFPTFLNMQNTVVT